MEDRAIPERFTVLEEIARNDAEILLRARDDRLQREVLLKLPGPGARRHILGKSREQTRVLREARALASVQHPSVARPLDVIETELGPLLVMEPLVGETLAARLERDGTLEVEEACTLGIALSGAVAAINAVGVVHRGVAEENIYLRPDGGVVLAGSVYAKPLDGVMSSLNYRSGSDDPGSSVALPSHPAPEQIAGQPADARSDVYGIGCVLYRAVTGRAAFPPDGDGHSQPPEPRASGTPKALSAAIMKCLARSPMARFQTAGALGEALEAAAAKTGGGQLSRRTVAAGGVAAVALVSLGVFGLVEWGQTRGGVKPPPPPPTIPNPTERDYAKDFSRSRALLIGIGSAYASTSHPTLRAPVKDITALGTELDDLGWEVTYLSDEKATRQAIEDALLRLDREAQRDDRVLIYFAGHGKQHERDLESAWILPADAGDDDRRRNWIALESFAAALRRSAAKHVMVALDCCYGGALPGLMAGGTRGRGAELRDPSNGLQRAYRDQYVSRRARVVLTAGLPGREVWDGDELSPFAECFVKALREKRETGLTGNSLYVNIRDSNLGNQPHFGCHRSTDAGADFVLILPRS